MALSVQRGAGVMSQIVANLLFPPVCAGCRVAVGGPDALCARCWTLLRFIERPYCDVLGLPFSYDPGEGAVSPQAIADPPPFARHRSAVIYDGLAARLVAALKYGDRTDLVPLMASWMGRAGEDLLADAEIVVPVPLHRGRLWRRRFNQSAELARALVRGEAARGRALASAPLALARVKATRSQVGLGRRQRQENVRGAFKIVPGQRAAILGRRVLLVDDVFTTGATVGSATLALIRAGARDVDVLTFARVAAEE
ncbi:amidophosphoribosyltransferase [Aureimonas sp. SA4125]|uniref:ComF family protein n=1 Tax=Aureimonas sp. SA4125 TaxID=2826993 RepID=UPI001CC34F15|nr:ComF family protein [Aureimonas sp. SA4125]BDA86104.1 amidophosphoribosyltransferase [Aureimonas sp. SA4125]